MRWVCRTPDQDGLGLAFPSTSEVEGYSAEKAKGQVVELGGGQTGELPVSCRPWNGQKSAWPTRRSPGRPRM